ncbi:uncharacterized protein LOC111276816 isoform X5 [Durio zibethinus]|uniref:Uncharacterized protein LOC111276816 isoform X5 n=1 Tax=Durio zibethinus TaxID=66656 RepID=A0A6P5WRX0_DURZI|nr:uncharacterized protein LOC111276816 isoform X5 [Durio zibethinus]
MSISLPMRLLLPLTTPTRTPSPPYYYSFLFSPNPNFTLSSQSHHSCSFRKSPHSFSKQKWLCGHTRRYKEMDGYRYEEEDAICLFSSDEDTGTQIPTQAQSIVEGSGAVMVSELKPLPDVDYLQELLAIQQQGPRAIGFFGTRNMGFMHQELIEILSYALVITKNHIYTSGASGTNAAVIRGALRAEKPELLTVILPQSLKKQPPESQELLEKSYTKDLPVALPTWNVACAQR